MEVSRCRGVQKQRHRKRFFCGLEVRDRLLYAIFENAEVFAFEIWNKTSVAIKHAYRNGDERSIHLHDVAFAYFFRTGDGGCIIRRSSIERIRGRSRVYQS